MVRGHFLQALYLGMLEVFPIANLRDFWRNHPLDLGDGPLEEGDLYEHLWRCGDGGRMDWVRRILDSLEPFCVAHGLRVSDVLERMGHRVNGGSFLPSKLLLGWIRPLVPLLFGPGSAWELVLQLLPFVTAGFAPGAVHQVIRESRSGSWHEAYVLYVQEKGGAETWPTDYHLFGAGSLQRAPLIFGVPPFNECRPLSDARGAEAIIRDRRPALRGGRLYLEGRRIGETIGFGDFCRGHGLSPVRHGLPDRNVILVTEDVFCRARKRTVLFRGCAYGAPAYLSLLGYRDVRLGERDFLGHLIDDLGRARSPLEARLQAGHRRLVALARGEARRLAYHAPSDSILLNGRTLIKGIPARLLRKVLEEHCARGPRIFTFAEFKSDPALFRDPRRTDFETHLNRLGLRLEQKGEGMRILPSGRGRFVFACGVPLTFELLDQEAGKP